MAYAPFTWVEKVSKVGPTNMNHLELGVQAAAAVADAALPTPAGTNGQFLKKVGGAWVPTSLASADLTGLVDRTAMAAGNKTTVGTLASGPPGAPSDGDIWIATAVDANGTRWTFQYNAGSASAYKWEYIGGMPLLIQSVPAAVINTLTQVGATGNYYAPASAYTTVRGGDYILDGFSRFQANGTIASASISTFAGAALVGSAGASELLSVTTDEKSFPLIDTVLGVGAGVVIGISSGGTAPGTTKIIIQTTRITPRRIA